MSHGKCDTTFPGGNSVTNKSPRDVSASVRARLLNISKRNSEAFDLVLVRFAIERLLYRLSQSKFRDRFVVKGAMMFQVWTRLTHRPTRDLDLLGFGQPDIDFFCSCFSRLMRSTCRRRWIGFCGRNGLCQQTERR